MKNLRREQQEILEYQPDAVEIEERPLPGKVRWVLYVILFSIILLVVSAIIFKVDRIVIAEGNLITTSPTIVVQPLNTAIIRSIDIEVGDQVKKGQILATLDATFANADLSQLNQQQLALTSQLRRIDAELGSVDFIASPDEGQSGRIQQQVFLQRKTIFNQTKKLSAEKIATLQAKLELNAVQQKGRDKELRLLRDVEGTTARLPRNGTEYHLRILEAQKNRFQTANEVNRLVAEKQVILHELKQAESEWQQFVEERAGELLEQKVQLSNESEKIIEEISKAKRLQDLVSLRASQDGIVLNIAKRSVGSIIQQAETFVTLVPLNSLIEVEVNVQSKDIARIRPGDSVRVKLDAFPFQRHDTLPGEVRVISEDSYRSDDLKNIQEQALRQNVPDTFYRARIKLLSTSLRKVPEGFRLLPGMKVRAEIKVGTRTVITYFLYPIIRAFDESLREP